ncbi:MAG: CYTH domain-containing protein [Lachnospiraceae bacterium]|nr:CYTH domain-containing protein [Lachnospiraceae bacterium]
MEIERKYLIKKEDIPFDLKDYPAHIIEQAYLCTEPVVRVRKDDDDYYMTYKGKGLKVREEYNLPLTADAYAHLLKKADGNVITKTRYLIPLQDNNLNKDLLIELDVFEGKFEGLYLAEVEFTSEEDADNFTPPYWFGEDVTLDGTYHNSRMSQAN